jgi:hypothetical protein
MKQLSAFLFLFVTLFCGLLLHAAGHNKNPFRMKKANGPVKNVTVKKDLELVPNIVLL